MTDRLRANIARGEPVEPRAGRRASRSRRTAALLATAAAATVLLGGCQPWHCDFWSNGACIEFTYDPGPLDAAKARVDRLLQLEMPFWGISKIDGWRIQFRTSQDYTCYFEKYTSGCTDYVGKTISVRVPPDDGGCFEASELLHELGHYTLGDPMHSASRWADVEPAFASIVWDRPDAPTACVARFHGVYSGMWTVTRNAF